jgi:hypothetical protein
MVVYVVQDVEQMASIVRTLSHGVGGRARGRTSRKINRYRQSLSTVRNNINPSAMAI